MPDFANNIREFLGDMIGQRVLDVTQHDPGEKGFIKIHFEHGSTMTLELIEGTEFFLLKYDGDLIQEVNDA